MTEHNHEHKLLKPEHAVGIVGYGAYVPRYRLPASEVARVWTDGEGGLPIKEKSVPGLDEDVVTMSIEAARNALNRAEIDPTEIRAVWVGSESHPYAVKPTSTIVAEAIGAVPNTQAADWEFACKAGTEAIVAAMGLVGSGMAAYAMAVGMDTAQGRPGDALEYTNVNSLNDIIGIHQPAQGRRNLPTDVPAQLQTRARQQHLQRYLIARDRPPDKTRFAIHSAHRMSPEAHLILTSDTLA